MNMSTIAINANGWPIILLILSVQMNRSDKRKLETFPFKLSHWDWKRWHEYSNNSRKLDSALTCCPCKLRGWYRDCDCEFKDEQNWLNDFLYVRKFQPPCIRPVNKNGAMVLHPLGFVMGPFTYLEWLNYSYELFDFCHEVASKKCKPDWSRVFFRHNDDFVGGHFRYFYPITLIMINQLQGLANKHGAANDCSRGVDLFETLDQKELNMSDVLRKKGHMITCPWPHFEYLTDIHKQDPSKVDIATIANKVKKRNLRYKKRIKQMRKQNKSLSWNNAMHYFPERAQNFKTWYPKFKNVPVYFDLKTKTWKLPHFYTDKRVEDSQPVLFNKTIEKWLSSGALFILKEDEDVDLVTPNVLANVQRVNGPPVDTTKKPRLCHDGGYEKNVEKFSFPCKLDDLRTVQKDMRGNDVMCVSDDQRGFHQQLLSRESRKLTAFSYKGVLFAYRVSPFGSPKIPATFQRANTVPVNYSRTLGARVNLYLDDRITLDQPQNVIGGIALSAFITTCMSICAGGFISLEKSDFDPKTVQQFLGMLLNTETGTISVPEDKWRRFKATIERILKQGFCTFKELEKLRGVAVSFILANPKTKLFIRAMNAIIAHLTKLKTKPSFKIKLTEQLTAELSEWIKLDHLQMSHKWVNIVELEQPPNRITFTDASSFSAAAVVFDGENQAWHFQQMFEEKDQPKGIFYKEALAIYWMLIEFEDDLTNKIILHFCDNESVCAAFSNLGSKVDALNDIITKIYKKLHQMGSTMKVFWISTHYQLADDKSRQVGWNEEYLPQCFFHKICRLEKFFPKVDVMATLANSKCDSYITLGKDLNPRCLAYDFFSYPPNKLESIPFYCFPPKNILAPVVNHLWRFYLKHDWMLVFHSFGEYPSCVAPLLQMDNIRKLDLGEFYTVVPAEKRIIIGEETHWGFRNRKIAKTFVFIHIASTMN